MKAGRRDPGKWIVVEVLRQDDAEPPEFPDGSTIELDRKAKMDPVGFLASDKLDQVPLHPPVQRSDMEAFGESSGPPTQPVGWPRRIDAKRRCRDSGKRRSIRNPDQASYPTCPHKPSSYLDPALLGSKPLNPHHIFPSRIWKPGATTI